MFNWWHKKGDEAARQQCRSWFLAARHRLYLYARRRADSSADVELLLSRTLERVAEAVYQGRVSAEEKSLLPYTLRALANEAMKMNMADSRRRRAEARYSSHRSAESAPDPLPAEDTHRRLSSLLSRLPEKQAEVVTLHLWEDLSFAEIGRMLGVGESTVRARYDAALRKMKQMMNENS